MRFNEKIERSLLKSITFRLLVITSDFIVIFLITHRYDITIGVVALSNLSSTILYFFHERTWNTIHWGKTKHKKE
jgi:uncharacterized membrane protein